MNLTQIASALLTMTDEELRTINSEVVSILNHRSKVKQFEATKAFKLGDKVYFISKQGQRVEGIIEKINIKSIKIKADIGIWNVSPTLIKVA